MKSYGAVSCRLILFALFLFLLNLLVGAGATTQTAVNTPADCSNAGLETELYVYQAPEHTQVVALNYRNKTEAACTLRPDGEPSQGPLLTLEPGAVAHTSFRWKTDPATADVTCHDLDHRSISVNRSPNGVLLVSSTLLPHICSAVQYGAYFSGPFAPDWRTETTGTLGSPTAPVLTSAKETYYEGEFLDLRLRLVSAMPAGIECPTLFETMRDANGFTRIDEIVNPKAGCHRWLPWRGRWKGPANEFDIDAGEGSRWGGLGVRTFVVSQLSAVGPDGEMRLVPSNAVTLMVADPSSITRVWGSTERGVRTDLTVDTGSYSLGQDIPLHIAEENVSAEVPVYGEPFRPRPGFGDYRMSSLRVQVLDEDGPIPQQFDGYGLSGSSGPTLCPGYFEKGKVVPVEMSLSRLGLLPHEPGTYRIVVRWSPFTTAYSSCEEVPQWSPDAPEDRPFVSVTSAPITIHVSGKATAEGSAPAIPNYTAWRRKFRLVDTSFGEETALLDRATHLEWLHANLTSGLSEAAISKQLKPGGRFEGWRFATAEEVVAFFVRFTSSKDGSTTDPAIERKLQRLLGGPLFTLTNEQTGRGRRSSSILIAGIRPATHEESPQSPVDPVTGKVTPLCSTCTLGFIYRGASIFDDTQDGRIHAYVNPNMGGGWSIADGAGSTHDGFFLVRVR